MRNNSILSSVCGFELRVDAASSLANHSYGIKLAAPGHVLVNQIDVYAQLDSSSTPLLTLRSMVSDT